MSLGVGACGKKGDPLPPIRLVPQAATDLVVAQRADALVLSSGYPNVATNGMALPALEVVEIWSLQLPASAIAEGAPAIRKAEIPARGKLSVALRGDDLRAAIAGDQLSIRVPLANASPSDDEEGALGFALRFVSSGKETSDFSNVVTIQPRGTVEAPGELRLEAEANGVRVSWSGAGEAGSRVYRRESTQPGQGGALATVAPQEESYLDSRARYGTRYIYSVTALAAVDPDVESLAAEEREIDYQDRFAPPIPTGLLALAEADRVRLSWQASPAGDLAGYVVWRSIDGGGFERLTAEPTATTSYLDATPGAGERRYRVSAVDTGGNESEPSEEASARLAGR